MSELRASKRRILLAAFVIVVVLAIWAFTGHLLPLVRTHDETFKLVGYVIGPLLALLGFAWARIDRAEIIETSTELERQRGEASQAHAVAELRSAEVSKAAKALGEAAKELDRREERIAELEADLSRLTTHSNELWKLRPPRPFPEYLEWLRDPAGARIVSIALFKGGVGKTHIAANFAAYVSEQKKKPVLLIDLDYQGSLSNMALFAAGLEGVGSNMNALLEQEAGLESLSRNRVHLAPELSRGWIVPADYPLSELENRLLLQMLLKSDIRIDVRYRLAHVLLNPAVRREYAAIIIDTPPRMTLGVINAFAASHHYLVPVKLDKISSQTVEPFVRNVESLKREMGLDIGCAGLIQSMTRQAQLVGNEERYLNNVREATGAVLGIDRDPFIAQNIPLRAVVINDDSSRLPYFLKDSQGTQLKTFYDKVFDEVSERIML